jgi:broad specificity phosphatase PhoE
MLSARVGLWLAEVQRDAVVVAHGGVSKVLLVASGAVRWL